MSALMPDYTWLATGGLHNLNPAMFTALKRYKIQLFPNLGFFPTRQKKADELKKAGFEVSISDLLERYAQPEDISAGFDLADYFIRWDLEFGWAIKEEGYPVFRDGSVKSKEESGYFAGFPIATVSFYLRSISRI